MTLKDITLKGTLNALIPRTQADLLHYSLGLNIFIITSLFFGVGIGLLVTVLVETLKELNDKFGFLPFLLKWLGTGEKTDFSGRDWWLTVLIPFVITCIMYLLNITDGLFI